MMFAAFGSCGSAMAMPPALPCTTLWPAEQILKAVADRDYADLAKLSNSSLQLDNFGQMISGSEAVSEFLSRNFSGAISSADISVFNELMVIKFNQEKSFGVGDKTYKYSVREGLLLRCDYATYRISKIELLGVVNDGQQQYLQSKWSVH
jgi:hypothetical protein